jgi:hypothetical protein
MRPVTLGLVTLGLIVAGCHYNSSYHNSGNSSGTMNSTTAAQDANDSESGMNQTMDAAVQQLVDTATASTPNDQPGTSLAAAVAGQLDAVNLSSLNAVTTTATFGSMHDSAGHARYPQMNGSFTVTSTGDAVASWPTGAGTVATDTITVTFDQGPVTFTDATSGATATITGGSFTALLSSNYTYASTQNWHLTLDAKWMVAVASPLTWTVTRTTGGIYGTSSSHSVVLSGNRHVALDLQRQNVTSPSAVNTLIIDRTLDGGAGGVSGVDPANPTQTYTNWVFTIDGSDHDVWNRFVHENVTWDLASTPARTVNAFTEMIFITRNGTKVGPYTSLQLLTLYSLLSVD